MAQMVKIILTRSMDLERWQRENGVPTVEGEDCVDAAEWSQTHATPNAFGVARGRSPVALSI